MSKIAEIKPQAAYSVYIHGFKSKNNFFSRIIIVTKQHYKNCIEDVLRHHFVSGINGESSISEHLRQIIALLIRHGRMEVTIPHLNRGRTQYINDT